MATKCRDCGRSILWAKDKDGKNIPMQRIEAFEISWTRNDHGVAFEREYQAHAVELKDMEVYIGHFKVCPGVRFLK